MGSATFYRIVFSLRTRRLGRRYISHVAPVRRPTADTGPTRTYEECPARVLLSDGGSRALHSPLSVSQSRAHLAPHGPQSLSWLRIVLGQRRHPRLCAASLPANSSPPPGTKSRAPVPTTWLISNTQCWRAVCAHAATADTAPSRSSRRNGSRPHCYHHLASRRNGSRRGRHRAGRGAGGASSAGARWRAPCPASSTRPRSLAVR